MKTTKLHFLVGLFVLLGIGAVTYLTLKVGTGSLIQGDTYLLESRFANAGGIHPGCTVTMSGVTVGRVEEVRMEPSDYSAIVTMKISSALHLPTDSMASIKTSGLIGDKFVALSAGADDTLLKPGERITLTESAVDLESLIGKMAFGSVDKGSNSKEKNDSTNQ
jgi:phospholipid/cholesterol/gamma-HCH transport system substrate-binding protein